jgi:hypothetical protein
MGRERHAGCWQDRSGDKQFRTQLPSRGWFVFQPPQLVAARSCLVSRRINPVRLPRNFVAVRRDDVRLGGNDVWLRGNDIRLRGNDVRLRGNDVRLRGNDVRLRGNDIRLPISLVSNNLRKNHRFFAVFGGMVLPEQRVEQDGCRRNPSRSDLTKVAVDFSPRNGSTRVHVAERRLKERFQPVALFWDGSNVAPRRGQFDLHPWVETHGYHQTIALRCPECFLCSTENSEEPNSCERAHKLQVVCIRVLGHFEGFLKDCPHASV